MKVTNQIINYFIDIPRNQPPKVFKFPVTMGSEIASLIINEETGYKSNLNTMVHIAYDMDSKIIYAINSEKFSNDKYKIAIQSAKYHILKEYNQIRNVKPINGSPFSSLRVRKVSNFKYIKNLIEKQYDINFIDLDVIEANLDKMPLTLKSLPDCFQNQNFYGGLIDESFSNEIKFTDEINILGNRKDNPSEMLTVKTPFILINIANSACKSCSEKEWAILNGYRDYLWKKNVIDQYKIESFAFYNAAKRFIYLGWTFEDICNVFLGFIDSLKAFTKGAKLLLKVKQSIKNTDQNISYYIAVKNINKSIIDEIKQNEIFEIKHNDKDQNAYIFKTEIYLNNNTSKQIFNVKQLPLTIKYDSNLKQILLSKNHKLWKKEISDIISAIKQNYNLSYDDFIETKYDSKFQLRKINDYGWAKDCIIKLCKSNKSKFKNIDVLVGPIDEIFGCGTQGGFMGKKQFLESNIKMPYEIDKGIFLNPPLIMVNSKTIPSYADQTGVLIHEYSHKIFSEKNLFHVHKYNKNKELQRKNPLKYWDLYLNDEDEKLAHKEQIKFELMSGKSVDEIIRDKIGGAITKENYKTSYKIAIMFKKIIDMAILELERG